MGRKTRKRDNYMSEAVTMRRFAESVELDDEARAEWRAELLSVLQRAMALFLQRDAERSQHNASACAR